jgi:hypothetical protein
MACEGNMKATWRGAAALALALLGASHGVEAQEQKDLQFTIGVKAWFNEWQSWFTPNNPGANVIASTASPKFAFIPTGTVKYRDFFLSTGYFTNASYSFPTFTEAVGGATVETKATAERKEIDVNFGWYFIPRAAVTVGYKQVRQDFTMTTTGGGFSGVPFTTKWLYTAPTIGITGSAPMTERVALYGNAAYGPVKVTMNGANQSGVTGSYSSSEFGVAWQGGESFTVTAGYKYQIVGQRQSGTYSGLALRDVSSGWIFGALLGF